MHSANWELLKLIAGGVASFFFVAGAAFEAANIALPNQAAVRRWFGEMWSTIAHSAWITLAERSVSALLRATARAKNISLEFVLERTGWSAALAIAFGLSFYGYLLARLYLVVGRFPTPSQMPETLAIMVLPFLSMFIYRIGTRISKRAGKETKASANFKLAGGSGFLLFFGTTWFVAIESASLLVSILMTVGLVLVAPVFLGGMVASALRPRAPEMSLVQNTAYRIGFVICFSFLVTLLSFVLGSIAAPSHGIPKTTQMLLMNALFDAITVAVTLKLLRWAIRRAAAARLPIAITADLLLSGALASMALFTGLYGGAGELKLVQVVSVLVGKSADGSQYQLGPLFWCMHTTFIPLLIYACFILLAWAGKVLLLPLKGIFRLSSALDKPLRLSAALCGLIFAVFVVLYWFFGDMQTRVERLEEHSLPQSPNTIELMIGSDYPLTSRVGEAPPAPFP